MVEKVVTQTLHRWVAVIALLAFPSVLFAHRLDEYLQATLVTIERDHIRLEINLTPGVAVAKQIVDQIDRDHDGANSKSEAEAYADLVTRDLVIQLDEQSFAPKLTASDFPSPAELRTGLGIIQMEFSVTPSRSLDAGKHKLTFENRHLPALSVYLVNAAKPDSDLVEIITQQRNNNQSTGKIDFTVHTPLTTKTAPSTSYKLPGLIALFAGLLVTTVAIGAKWRAGKTCRAWP